MYELKAGLLANITEDNYKKKKFSCRLGIHINKKKLKSISFQSIYYTLFVHVTFVWFKNYFFFVSMRERCELVKTTAFIILCLTLTLSLLQHRIALVSVLVCFSVYLRSMYVCCFFYHLHLHILYIHIIINIFVCCCCYSKVYSRSLVFKY